MAMSHQKDHKQPHERLLLVGKRFGSRTSFEGVHETSYCFKPSIHFEDAALELSEQECRVTPGFVADKQPLALT